MKRGLSFFAGILVGATLFGGSVAYAAGVMAERSNHVIMVDGKQVQMEAYVINGNNYVKLRDIGEAVDFNVYWDKGVHIESQSKYTGLSPTNPIADSTATTIPQTDEKLILKEGDTVL